MHFTEKIKLTIYSNFEADFLYLSVSFYTYLRILAMF